MVVNASHMKALPGRKTDVKDFVFLSVRRVALLCPFEWGVFITKLFIFYSQFAFVFLLLIKLLRHNGPLLSGTQS